MGKWAISFAAGIGSGAAQWRWAVLSIPRAVSALNWFLFLHLMLKDLRSRVVAAHAFSPSTCYTERPCLERQRIQSLTIRGECSFQSLNFLEFNQIRKAQSNTTFLPSFLQTPLLTQCYAHSLVPFIPRHPTLAWMLIISCVGLSGSPRIPSTNPNVSPTVYINRQNCSLSNGLNWLSLQF